MSVFKRRWQLHQLKKHYAECDKRFIKKQYKECKYDAVKCRVALNNAEMEDGAHNIYGEPVNQETSDPGDPSYANAPNSNTTDHQVIRPENPVRRSVSYQGLDASEMVWRAHELCNYQDDTFDESEISPMVQRSPKLGDDPTGEHTSTSDLPEYLLILTPRPIRKITVYRPDAPGVEFRACESRDYKGNKGALNAPKLPNLCNDFANAYVSAPLPPKPIVHRREGQDICRQISTSASHLAAPEANSPDCSSNPHGSFRINIEPASSSSNSQSSADLVTNASLSTQSSQFLHPLACLLDANYSSNAFSSNTEYK